MKNTKTILAVISIVAPLSMAPAVFAQPQGLVRVAIRNVAEDISRNIYVSVRDIPKTVDVRPHIAAEVCKVPEEVFSVEKSAKAGCLAEMTVPALDRIVEWQIKYLTRP